CGYGPIAAMCSACRYLGAREARLLRYATSGDVTGDPDVVGYAAIAVI
ncbi:MAG: AmmeMemoRadiSam system protein B, partial [Methanolinea sp.]|nr:AmmeMemoRadiSam system protein B [Methanolinea sp.]